MVLAQLDKPALEAARVTGRGESERGRPLLLVDLCSSDPGVMRRPQGPRGNNLRPRRRNGLRCTELICADVTRGSRVIRPGDTTLVGGRTERRGSGVAGGTICGQRHRLRWTAVVRQRCDQRIRVDVKAAARAQLDVVGLGTQAPTRVDSAVVGRFATSVA